MAAALNLNGQAGLMERDHPTTRLSLAHSRVARQFIEPHSVATFEQDEQPPVLFLQ
jgi:hypothetical protein